VTAVGTTRKVAPGGVEGRSGRVGRVGYVGFLALLAGALLVALLLGLGVGSVGVHPLDSATALLHQVVPGWVQPTGPDYVETIVVGSRAPRVLLGAVVGAGLAVVGTVMQAIVRNPLADPYLLGVSSGASVAAVLVIVGGVTVLGAATLPVAAFAGALASMLVVWWMARAGGRVTTTRLVLSGISVAYVLSGVTSLVIILASNADRSREVLRWLLGGLGGADWGGLPLPAVAVAVGLTLLIAQGRALNTLLAGDEAARVMGLDVARFRMRMFVLTSLVTGVLVAVSGPIGFVGLILPHAVRMVVGGDHRRVLPAAALGGASFLVLADVAARSLASPQEIPVGILTSLCGGPFFLWLVRRDARRGAGATA
jgi:iron complex transport system permease protein